MYGVGVATGRGLTPDWAASPMQCVAASVVARDRDREGHPRHDNRGDRALDARERRERRDARRQARDLCREAAGDPRRGPQQPMCDGQARSLGEPDSCSRIRSRSSVIAAIGARSHQRFRACSAATAHFESSNAPKMAVFALALHTTRSMFDVTSIPSFFTNFLKPLRSYSLSSLRRSR